MTLNEDQLMGRIVMGILRRRFALVCFIIFSTLILLAMIAPWIAPQDPYDQMSISFLDNNLPPLSESMTGTTYYLGTDNQGRDMLSAMLFGLRTSLSVGILSGLIALIIGTTLGLIAAYFGGKTDALIMRLVDLMLGFPTILVALIMLAVLGQGVSKVIFALVLVQWAYFARTARASAMSERGKDYIKAAHCLGLSNRRIIFKHLLPNCLPPIIVIAMIQVANAISAEATLSFLGIGLPITEPSLGLLIANGYNKLISGVYWSSVYPGLLLLVLIFSMNIVGDALRDIVNPRLQK